MEQSVKNRFKEYKQRSHLRESSTEILDRAMKWFFREIMAGNTDPNAIKYNHIDKFKGWLVSGRARESADENSAKSTANTYLAITKPFFGWMRKCGYIASDPFDGIDLYAVAQKKCEPYTHQEIERILTVADLRWKAIVCLALCSMRQAEILNLIVSDIQWDKKWVRITAKRNSKLTWKWEIKDRDEALVGIDDSIIGLLGKLCASLKSDQPYVILKEKYYRRNMRLKKEKKLKSRLRNCPWGNFSRDWKDLLRRADVRPRWFHTLRDVFASERYYEGYTMKDLQGLMRHASIETTARYIRRIEEEKLVAASAATFTKHYATLVA